MPSKYLIPIALIILPVLAGCAASRLETDYGASYKLAEANQILNPDAGKNLAPVYGIDGEASDIILQQYRKSFIRPVKQPVYSFGIIQEK